MPPRYAVITGGSSGIGLATARRLVIEGWHVVIAARDARRLDAASAALVQACGDANWVETASVDVADEVAIHDWAARLLHRRGAPSLLVASAGIAKPDYFEALSAEDFRAAMEINYFGTLHVVRAFAPAMRAARAGAVVLLSSGAGLVGIFGYAAYAPAKFAVRGLGEVLRAEFAPQGVSVHVVCPPDTDTPQLEQENLTKPRETLAIGGHGGIMSPEAVACAILDGVRRRRFLITPGVRMTLLGSLHSVLAPLLRFLFDRTAREAAGDSRGIDRSTIQKTPIPRAVHGSDQRRS